MTETTQINIGLIGFGNIGTGVVNALNNNGDLMAERVGVKLNLTRIADLDTERKRNADYDPAILSADTKGLLNDPSIDVVIELMGGIEPARTFVETALKNGKHVLTANKAMLANHGAELFALAEEKKVKLLFEASVGGGIPNIRAMMLGLCPNRIKGVYGILNGTCNYILTQMTQTGMDFGDALEEAKRLGYAEPDPTYDIEGLDTAHKIAILASLSFGQDIRFKDVFVEGITRLSATDIKYATELGYTIKLLGLAKLTEDGQALVRVHPTLLPKESQLAKVSGVFNAVLTDGDLVDKTMMYGRGAGASPTAAAICSDLMEIAAFKLSGNSTPRRPNLRVPVGSKKLMPIGELNTKYYLRFRADDKLGVLSKISASLGKNGVSICSMMQHGPHKTWAEIILVTHPTCEAAIEAAVAEINVMPEVNENDGIVLRVEEGL